MSRKNIRQNHFNRIKKELDEVDKAGDNSKHFRCIVLMGDKNVPKAYSFLHASPEDLKNLILNAMRNSDQFTYATAMAFEQYDKELREKETLKVKFFIICDCISVTLYLLIGHVLKKEYILFS